MSSESTVRVPQQARSIKKRNRLVEAGMALFGEKGFQGTNAKEIAEKAGVSVGSFYAYFTDKKALLMEVLIRHMEEVDSSVFSELGDMIRAGATGREIMRRTVPVGARVPPPLAGNAAHPVEHPLHGRGLRPPGRRRKP